MTELHPTARCPNRGCRARLCVPVHMPAGVKHCACLYRPVDLRRDIGTPDAPVVIEAESGAAVEGQIKISRVNCGHPGPPDPPARRVEDLPTDLL